MQYVMHAYLSCIRHMQVAWSPAPAQKLGGAWGRGYSRVAVNYEVPVTLDSHTKIGRESGCARLQYKLIHVCTQYALRSGEL